MTRLAKFALFLSSFSPLFVMLAVRFAGEPLLVPVGLAAFGLLAAAGGLALIEWTRGGQADRFVIIAVESRAESLTGYLVGYLFPFLVLDMSDTLSVAATILFGALLALIYVEANLLYLNPILILRGRHLWQVQARRVDDPHDVRSMTLLVDAPLLRRRQCVQTTHIAGDVWNAKLVRCDA